MDINFEVHKPRFVKAQTKRKQSTIRREIKMFPAYVQFSKDTAEVQPQTSKEFLQNPSYSTVPVSSSTVAVQISSDSEFSSDSDDRLKSRTLEKPFKKSPSPKVEFFYVDRERKKEYLKLNSLPLRAIPFYRVSRHLRNFSTPYKHQSFRRYYKAKRIKKLTQEPKKLLDDNVSQDEEMRIYLIKNSQEVDKWIEFIQHKVKLHSPSLILNKTYNYPLLRKTHR